jgi:methylthioribose-1-phosphate isomerase
MNTHKVDMAIVGAEAVVESGGVINRTGTYQVRVELGSLSNSLTLSLSYQS